LLTVASRKLFPSYAGVSPSKCGVPSSFLLDRNLFADFLLRQGDLEHPFAEVFLGSGREKQPIRAAL